MKQILINEINSLLQEEGLTISQAAEILNIPYRTLQNWCNGSREYASYMPALLRAKLEQWKEGRS